MADKRVVVFELKLNATATIKTQNDLIKRNKELAKLIKDAPLEGAEGYEQFEKVLKQARQEYARNREQLKRLNRELRETDVPTDSLEGYKRTLRDLEKEYRQLSAAEREAFGEELQREILSTRNALKRAEEELGDFRRSVGQYPKGAEQAARATRALTKSINQFQKLVRAGFGLSRLATVVSRITGFFGNIIDANKDTNAAIGGIAQGFDALGQSVTDFGTSILTTLAPVINSVTRFFTNLVNSVNSFINPLDASIQAFQNQARVVSDLETDLVPLLDRYDELSAETELTAQEQAELDAIIQEVSDTVPGAVEEIDKYGKVLTISTDAARDFVQQQRNILAAANRERIAQQTQELVKQEAELVRSLRDSGKSQEEIQKILQRTGIAQEEVSAVLERANKNIEEQDRVTGFLSNTYRGATAIITGGTSEIKRVTDAFAESNESLTESINRRLKENQALTDQIALQRGAVAGLRGDINDLDGSNLKAATTIEQLQQKQSQLTTQIKNLAVQGKDYSIQLTRLRAVQEQLAIAEEAVADRSNIVERLREQESDLIETIEVLAVLDKDFTAQQEQLIEVQERLAKAEAARTSIQQSQLNVLEQQQRQQRNLQNEIQLLIATNQPYEEQLKQLTEITIELERVQKEYKDAIGETDDETETYSKGSLADYQKQLSDLNEQLNTLTIGSEEYNAVQSKITALTDEQARALELLNTRSIEFANTTKELQDTTAVQAARLSALQRADIELKALANSEQTAEQRAASIKAIEQQLANDLKEIDRQALTDRQTEINQELALLQEKETQELANKELTEEEKTAIQAINEQERTKLVNESLGIDQKLKQADLQNFKEVEAGKTQTLKEEAEKRKQTEQQIFDTVSAISTSTISLIAEATNARLAETQRVLEAEKQAALESAIALGASETTKAEIEEQFRRKQEEAERAAAEKQRALSITQAIINTALSITRTLSQLGIPAGIPASIAAAAAGAVQVATISNQKLAKGDILSGPSHDGGGVKMVVNGQNVVEAEGGEAVVNKKSTGAMPNTLSAINQLYGGKQYAGTTKLSSDMRGKLVDMERSLSAGRLARLPRFNAVPRIQRFQDGGITPARLNNIGEQFNSKAFLRAVQEGAKLGTEQGFAMATKMINDRARKQANLEARLDN